MYINNRGISMNNQLVLLNNISFFHFSIRATSVFMYLNIHEEVFHIYLYYIYINYEG